MSPRKPASEELTREMILKEARLQFIEKDFQKVSMRNIAKQLGCSHGAIYYHFKNKAELFNGVVEEDFARLNQLIENVVEGNEDDESKLTSIFLRFIEFGLDHQSQYEIMFMTRNSEVDSLNQQAAYMSYQKFAQSVQTLCRKRLAIKDVWSAFIALHGFVSYYRGYVTRYEDVKVTAEGHVKFIVKGLKSS
ncbi:TetR/AcrR family transcriptional regulator [Anaerobacillus alkaliphilus]|uniref:TetR/AcrR family transcriptional regulator n=1 Tax=Anaerobacillus alkaliphilus TaxID=1548597 RepID=A0A4V1LGX8_9BACI|nr:TetR/AcrR family transcriptional regulator [Anaerobacillus alkaliphilus]RXJ04285.1 TetR/AcrR family transcriptional regulator [Anaerobacillus alkaliphilus]